jgi:hypothetical protein
MRSDLKTDLRELELRIERQIERILIVRSVTQRSKPSAICRRPTMALYPSFPPARGPDCPPKQSFGANGHDGKSCPPHLPFAMPVGIGSFGWKLQCWFRLPFSLPGVGMIKTGTIYHSVVSIMSIEGGAVQLTLSGPISIERLISRA